MNKMNIERMMQQIEDARAQMVSLARELMEAEEEVLELPTLNLKALIIECQIRGDPDVMKVIAPLDEWVKKSGGRYYDHYTIRVNGVQFLALVARKEEKK